MEIEEQRAPPSIHEENPATEQAQVEPAVSVAEVPAQDTAPSITGEDSAVEQAAPAVSGLEHPTTYFDIPAPQPVVPSGDYSTQIWAGQGENPKGGVSAKQSIASLASSVGWSNAQGNGNTGYAQGGSTVQ
jgi:hypothetical protein